MSRSKSYSLIITYLLNLIILANLIYLITITFKIPKALAILGILASIFALIILLFMIVVLLLDLTYRPETKQYPFNIVLDRIIPCIAIFTPTFLVLSLDLETDTTWIQKFGYIILIHLIVLVPLFYFWSKQRHWASSDNAINVPWTSPLLYYCISIAITYVSIWGFFLTVLRYIRIKENGISIYYTPYMIELLLIAISLLPYIIIGVIILLNTLVKIKKYLWAHVELLLYSLHINLLKYDLYFFCAEKLYKFCFIIYNFISLSAPLNINLSEKEFPLYRRVIHYCFCYPFIITILIFISIIFEIILTGKIYYGLYTLFIYPILNSIITNLMAYENSFLIIDVCLSDYLELKTTNIRYPLRFWFVIRDPIDFFGFEVQTTPAINEIWQKECTRADILYSKYLINRTNLLLRVSGLIYDKKTKKVIKAVNYTKQAYCKRLKFAYFKTNGVRWYHTAAISNYPLSSKAVISFTQKMHVHPIVLHCSTTIAEHLALLDTTVPFNAIQKSADTKIKTYDLPNLFINNPKIIVPTRAPNFINIVEISEAHAFQPLTKDGVISGTIKEMRNTFPKKIFPSMQENPDVGHDFSQSTFKFKSSFATDFKNIDGKTIFANRNQISTGDINKYFLQFDAFVKAFSKKHPQIIPLVKDILIQLEHAAKEKNWDLQLNIWASNSHLFPPLWKPPLYYESTLVRKGFHPYIDKEIFDAKRRLRFLSRKAYELNIPEDNFSGSHIQQLMLALENEYSSSQESLDFSLWVD